MVSPEISKIGEMPTPYFSPDKSTVLDARQGITIKAYSPIGEIDTFSWIQNYTLKNDFNDANIRNSLATLITIVQLEQGIAMAVGPAIDLTKSSRETNQIVTNKKPDTIGIYIETKHAETLPFLVNVLHQSPNPIKYRELDPGKFDSTMAQVLCVMPHNLSNHSTPPTELSLRFAKYRSNKV